MVAGIRQNVSHERERLPTDNYRVAIETETLRPSLRLPACRQPRESGYDGDGVQRSWRPSPAGGRCIWSATICGQRWDMDNRALSTVVDETAEHGDRALSSDSASSLTGALSRRTQSPSRTKSSTSVDEGPRSTRMSRRMLGPSLPTGRVSLPPPLPAV